MRLRVDWTACDGRGLCTELLPEVLAADDWGYPLARAEDIEARLEPFARMAVDHCPRRALRLERVRQPT
jgi:ferredoxin